MTQNDIILFLKTKETFLVDDKQLLYDIFANYRPNVQKGWRLTDFGFNTLSKYIQPLVVNLEENISYKEYVTMAKCFSSPYYIKEPKLILFDPFVHSMVSMFGVDAVYNMRGK